jgi:hypothetical protein
MTGPREICSQVELPRILGNDHTYCESPRSRMHCCLAVLKGSRPPAMLSGFACRSRALDQS